MIYVVTPSRYVAVMATPAPTAVAQTADVAVPVAVTTREIACAEEKDVTGR